MFEAPNSATTSVANAMSTLTTWVFAGSSLSAVAGGAWAAFRYFAERRRDREQREAELKQREAELRWRRAQAGKGLLDDLHHDPQAAAALQMLDSWSRTYTLGDTKVVIKDVDWLGALLNAPDSASDQVGIFVRDSFDALFYHMAMLEHHIKNDFVKFSDVVFPLDYYVAILAEDKTVHEQYIKFFRLTEAEAFLNRFSSWTSPSGKVLKSRVGPSSAHQE